MNTTIAESRRMRLASGDARRNSRREHQMGKTETTELEKTTTATSAPSVGAATSAEIEVTPEMIAAGVSAFLEYDSRFENEACAVEDIYRAMVTAKGHHSLER
jgi:hypothetical protein